MTSITDQTKRHEFVLLFDVKDGNPNGDPDAGNLPRTDPDTGHGFVTDVAVKRKVRNFLSMTANTKMFIQSRDSLNELKSKAALELQPPLTEKERKSNQPIDRLRSQLCEDYYDIRMFGAVLATGEKGDRLNAGQVRGPVQLTFARSFDPVDARSVGITRQARTTNERMETGQTEMGQKTFVHYGLYMTHGFFNPFLACQTGVSSEDLALFWAALQQLFELDRSSSRGEMGVHGLYVFSHESKLGNAPARSLFKLVSAERLVGTPRSADDYKITRPDEGSLAVCGFPGVSFTVLAEG